MAYHVRTRFHHPDPEKSTFYKIGETIKSEDEPELEKAGFLKCFCTRVDELPASADAVSSKQDTSPSA